MLTMLKRAALSLTACCLALAAHAAFVSFAVNGAAPPAYVAPLDTYPASPGAWTVGYSMRLLRSAYVGNAVQVQRSDTNATLDVGFSNGLPNAAAASSFCSTVTLNTTTSSARAALPAGTDVWIVNTGANPTYYAVGNSSVTASISSAGSALTRYSGVHVTVGANVDFAGINANGTTSTLVATNCGASKWYDQVNSNDLVQATQSKQMAYLPNGWNGYPVLVGCSGCGMIAPDNASYKTGIVETFTVMALDIQPPSASQNLPTLVYPNALSGGDACAQRWGLAECGYMTFLNVTYNNANDTQQGVGAVYRGNLAQYDTSTGDRSIRINTLSVLSGGSSTITYPTATGLYLATDSAGDSTPGYFAEALVASGTQTARNSISTNQTTFWGVTTPVPVPGVANQALTNPLSDGFNWSTYYFGDGPGGLSSTVSVNGSSYGVEGALDSYSSWNCTNCSTASGQLGDLHRFSVHNYDSWSFTVSERSELDGAYGTTYGQGQVLWISYAVLIEPGTPFAATSWNIHGQYHTLSNQTNCCVFDVNFGPHNPSPCTDCWEISHINSSSSVDTTDYTSAQATRGVWHHFVFETKLSSNSTDIFNVWCDCASPGTMAQVVTASGNLFGTANTTAYWKYGIYRGDYGSNMPDEAVRYGNMQVCVQGSDCTTKYGSSDLSARATSPLANPAHL